MPEQKARQHVNEQSALIGHTSSSFKPEVPNASVWSEYCDERCHFRAQKNEHRPNNASAHRRLKSNVPPRKELAHHWSDDSRAIDGAATKDYSLCGCLGNRPGEPLCRCAMMNVIIVDGRYVEVRDNAGKAEIIDRGPA